MKWASKYWYCLLLKVGFSCGFSWRRVRWREGRVERRCMYAIGCVCVHVCVMARTEALSMYLLPRSCMWWQADIRVKAPWSRVEQMPRCSLSFPGGVICRPGVLTLSLSLSLSVFQFTLIELLNFAVRSSVNILLRLFFPLHLFAIQAEFSLGFFVRQLTYRSVFVP